MAASVYLTPFAEWLIGGDQQGAALVAATDQFEQHAGFGLILADIGDVVEHEQVILVKLGDHAFEAQFAARDLQALDEFAGAHEHHAPSVLDEGKPDGCRQVTLAGSGRTEQKQIGALFEPAVARRERHHLRLADHRHGCKVEACERLADRQAGFSKVALDAAAATLGDFVLGERDEEARRRPAFLVGQLGKLLFPGEFTMERFVVF